MIITLSVLLIGAAIIVGLTYNGVFADKRQRRNSRQKWKKNSREVKKKVKSKLKK